MKLSIAQKISKKVNLALTCKKLSEIDSSIFSNEEFRYLKKALKDKEDSWVTINQYSRNVFVYIDTKHKPGSFQHSEKMRKAGADLAVELNKMKATSASINAGKNEVLLAEGAALRNYQFLKYFSDRDKKQNSLNELFLHSTTEDEIIELNNLIDSVYKSRDLINLPVWDLNADDLADEAKGMAKKYGFKIDVFNKKKIESLKMGGILAVNKGSIDPPAFIIMEYKPKKAKNDKPIVLVGKGVVYDTGGLSLKPTNFMDDMKCDMSGAAAVLGTMQAVASNKLPYHVVGLVPATDNRPGGNAVTPGDVITMYSGKTVEVLNTDAEGRLILADALHYAKKYDPAVVIDLATLTGAAARAIGKYGIVAMGEADKKYWNQINQSGENVYERLVTFPFWDEYDEMLESPIADLKNIGGLEGGAITAGKFLANFTDYPYIHLDIAGPAFVTSDYGYITKGGTGVGVRLLYDFIKNYS